MADRHRLETLTRRWRQRRDARQPAERPLADPDREALAASSFPYRSVSPAEYVAAHGSDMSGYTFDEARYADSDLDAWLAEVGRLLRERR